MTVNRGRLNTKLFKGLYPQFDDPRRKFVRKMQKQLTGGLETGNLAKSVKPKTGKPRRRAR